MASRGVFPEGLRVLVVDGDFAALKKLETILKKRNYEVWTCNFAREAISRLGEKNEKFEFDVVMSDVNMSDMDGFEFIHHVALVMNIPVIMMSEDEETSNVMKGVRSGACNYLHKPIRPKDVRYIWIHSFRKRINQIEGGEDDNNTTKIGGMKTKDLIESSNRGDGECEVGSSSSVKSPRLIWTDELHQKFVKAVEIIGLHRAGPKKILKLMGETCITREQVASHLQKFRNNKKILGEKEPAIQASADIDLQQQGSGVLPPRSTYQDMTINGNRGHNNNIGPFNMGSTDQFFEPTIQIPSGPENGCSFRQPLDIPNSQVQFEFQMQLANHHGIRNSQVQFESRMPQTNHHHIQNSQAYEPQMQQVDHRHIQNSQIYIEHQMQQVDHRQIQNSQIYFETQMQQVDHHCTRNADVMAAGVFPENGFNCPSLLTNDVPFNAPFGPQNQIYPPNASNTVPPHDFDSDSLIREYLNDDPNIYIKPKSPNS